MKKILAITIFYFMCSSFNLFSQSNLVWTINDKMENGFFKTTTIFNSSFSGFNSNSDAVKFIQTLKGNPEIASCDVISSNNTSCIVKFVMKRTHDKAYYINFSSKHGISSLIVNGTRKSLEELKQGTKK